MELSSILGCVVSAQGAKYQPGESAVFLAELRDATCVWALHARRPSHPLQRVWRGSAWTPKVRNIRAFWVFCFKALGYVFAYVWVFLKALGYVVAYVGLFLKGFGLLCYILLGSFSRLWAIVLHTSGLFLLRLWAMFSHTFGLFWKGFGL